MLQQIGSIRIRKMEIASLLLVFFSVLVLPTCGCKDKTEPDAKATGAVRPVKVAIAHAQPTPRPMIFEVVGTVHAQVTATVSSKLMGIVRTIAVSEGDAVKKGDLLAILDEREVDAYLLQAQAALSEARKGEDAARAGAEQAELEYKRYQMLLEGEAATRQDFEAVEARHKQARALLEAARYRVEQAEAALAATRVAKTDARVTAPFDGRISAKLVDVGDLASPGTPLLAVERAGPYRVDFLVPEAHIQGVKAAQTVAVHIPAVAETPLKGKVTVIVPAADEASRSFLVKVGLPVHPLLRSGMFARGSLAVGTENVVLISLSALVAQGQLTGIFVVDQDKIARYRLIRVGRTLGDKVEVLSGLEPGVTYVVAPGLTLVNGTPVEPET